MRSDEAELGRFLFGASGVKLLATPKNTLTEFRSAFRDNSYAICTMGVHSDWSGQELEQGQLSSSEILQMKNGAILTLNHGCFTGNWCVSAREGMGPCTAQAWIFGAGPGITTVANVRSGCIYGYPQLCESLQSGDSIGRAYLQRNARAKQRCIAIILTAASYQGFCYSATHSSGSRLARARKRANEASKRVKPVLDDDS